MISKQQLHYFIAVCKEKTLSRAADVLGIAQPSLSIAIKEVELILGAQLFVRHRKGVTLTPAGKELLAHSKKLLEFWNGLKTSVLNQSQEVLGQYTLGCPAIIGQYCLPKFLPILLKEHPKLKLTFKNDHSKTIYEDLMQQRIDIGIVTNPIPHESLIIHRLYSDKTSFWVHKKLIDKEDFPLKETHCFYNSSLTQSQHLVKNLKKSLLKNLQLIHCDSMHLVKELAHKQCGIGIIPKTLADSFHHLKELSTLPSYADEICLIYRKEYRDLKGIQAIINAAQHVRN